MAGAPAGPFLPLRPHHLSERRTPPVAPRLGQCRRRDGRGARTNGFESASVCMTRTGIRALTYKPSALGESVSGQSSAPAQGVPVSPECLGWLRCYCGQLGTVVFQDMKVVKWILLFFDVFLLLWG